MRDVLYARHHEGGERIVNHRLVVDGHQLLANTLGNGVEACAGSTG
jgi:hypothetical protein